MPKITSYLLMAKDNEYEPQVVAEYATREEAIAEFKRRILQDVTMAVKEYLDMYGIIEYTEDENGEPSDVDII